MLKYQYKGETIEVKLPEECGYKDFSVECQYKYNKFKDKYALSMWLKYNGVNDRFKIDSQEIDTQYISGSKATIRQNICMIVEQASLSDYFKPYIERYLYTYQCFEKGNDIFENERTA